MSRPPSVPPELSGYRPLRHLGSGGFADVFLYQQQLPYREVAVKVLAESMVTAEAKQRFVTEANTMAQLSAHPSIVTIHFAGIAPDGRPCLVMEYCPRPNLGVRMRSERIELAEVLRIGVRLASAVETAHRAGILHRDIKPANVLVTAYNWPKLADFGIAAQIEGTALEAEGMSIPWSAPELFATIPTSEVTTDVYSLGATVYGLLSGRAPFEIRGGDNSAAAMIQRIERLPVPSMGRDDVPDSVHQILTRAMHKRAEARFRTAHEFAIALQATEQELGLPPTPIEVLETGTAPVSTEDPGVTRVRPVVSISDEPGLQRAEDSTSGRTVDALGSDTDSRSRSGTRGGLPGTLDPLPDSTRAPAATRRPIATVIALVAVVAIIAVVVGVALWGPDATPAAEPSGTNSGVVRQEPVQAPTDGRCTRDGATLSCEWSQPDTAAGWTWRLSTDTKVHGTVDRPRVELELPAAETPPCISVTAFNASGGTSSPVTFCAS